jgi:hypothetical protein
MRNIITVLLAGSLLSGCLSDDGSSLVRNGSADDPTGNTAPTINGSPRSGVLYGEMYDFEPDAFDADGDTLTFSVQNKPVWANFDSRTGRLYGQPTLAHVDVYRNIQIGVSDGKSSASLRSYSIAVSQTGLGAFTMSWEPPTENTDGSPLLDLAGYKIYYGPQSERYDHELHIDNPGMTDFVVEQLVPGTYFVAVTSVNSVGVESVYSEEVVRIVN